MELFQIDDDGRLFISPALDHIVKHCLEKDRESRFQTARDIAFSLSEQFSPTAASGASPNATPQSRARPAVVATRPEPAMSAVPKP